MKIQPVTFYMPELESPHEIEYVDPDADWHLLGEGRFQTVAQTYLRLRHAGYAVRISTAPPSHGIVVVFGLNLRQLVDECTSRRKLIVCCVEADRPVRELTLADILVRHNGLDTDGIRRIFIPNWPQGGMVKRSAERGEEVKVISYKGRRDNLHPMFFSNEWYEYVHSNQLSFNIDDDLCTRTEPGLPPPLSSWNDYSSVDLILAARPRLSDPNGRKPGLKLVNAWMAGVPALLGPEYAYRELRRSRLDYMEIDSLESTKAAVTTLRTHRELYRRMVENGWERARSFGVETLTRQWGYLLFHRLQLASRSSIPMFAQPATTPARRVRRRAKRFLREWKDPYSDPLSGIRWWSSRIP